jgi:hypothetical protein
MGPDNFKVISTKLEENPTKLIIHVSEKVLQASKKKRGEESKREGEEKRGGNDFATKSKHKPYGKGNLMRISKI